MPFTFGRWAQRNAAALLTELDPDDPFIAAIAQGERMWTGVSAIHWTLRSIPGVPREVAERQLVLTSRQLLTIAPLAFLGYEPDADELDVFEAPYAALGLPEPRDSDGTRAGIRRYSYAQMDRIRFRKVGLQGLLGFTYRRSDGEDHDVEYSTARAVAKVLVAKLQLLHEQFRESDSTGASEPDDDRGASLSTDGEDEPVGMSSREASRSHHARPAGDKPEVCRYCGEPIHPDPDAKGYYRHQSEEITISDAPEDPAQKLPPELRSLLPLNLTDVHVVATVGASIDDRPKISSMLLSSLDDPNAKAEAAKNPQLQTPAGGAAYHARMALMAGLNITGQTSRTPEAYAAVFEAGDWSKAWPEVGRAAPAMYQQVAGEPPPLLPSSHRLAGLIEFALFQFYLRNMPHA